MNDSIFFKCVFSLAVAAVFIGDVRVPQTVPLSILIALLFILRLPNVRISLPFILLFAVLLSGLINLILAGYYDAERDFVIYLPVVYGLFVLFVAGGFKYGEMLRYSLGVGGLILCCLVYWAFLFSAENPIGYYQLKLTAETPLGRSNYLAAFLGFFLLVSTFWSRWLSILVVPAFVLAMSRTGILLVAAFLILRFILVRRYALWVIVAVLAVAGLAYYYSGHIYELPEIALEGLLSWESFAIRIRAWLATIDVIQANPFFGVPRGYYRDALEAAVPGENLWDPHNSILHILVSFGVVGFLFYLAYVITIFREIFRASLSDRFWRGVCWGYSLILVWSLFEPLLLTPAIELLQAYLFVMARKYNLRGAVAKEQSQMYIRDMSAETK